MLPKPVHVQKAPKPLRRSSKPLKRGPAPNRTKRPARKRKGTTAKLFQALEKKFADYVKARDGNVCVTCGKTVEPGNLNAGHFIPRTRKSLIFDPANCHSQCAIPCNYSKRGAPREYALAILDKYGPAGLRRLMARKLIDKKWTRPELEYLIAAIDKSGADFECAYYERYL